MPRWAKRSDARHIQPKVGNIPFYSKEEVDAQPRLARHNLALLILQRREEIRKADDQAIAEEWAEEDADLNR